MKTNNTTNTNTSKNLIDVILEHNIQADTPVKFEGRQIFKSSTTGKIYICNPDTKRAFVYDANGKNCKAISLECFRTQFKAVQTRVQRDVEADRRIREKVQKFEAEKRTDHNAILLDAEREDSKFDYRQSEDILSTSEVEAYEEGKGFFDDEEEPAVTLGHHRAMFTKWEEVKETTKTARDGSRYVSKAYLKLTFMVNGTEFNSRCYGKAFESFKMNVNATHHGIFNYTKSSKVLDLLVGEFIDIWVIWNDTLNELQAEFFDRAAWEAKRARKAQVAADSVRGSYGRPTENKATR